MNLHAPEEILHSIYVRDLDSNNVVPLARVDELSPTKTPRTPQSGGSTLKDKLKLGSLLRRR